jgi:single-strand DNA-binding protein
MASFNKVILLGNLTRDPETRVTPGGLTIVKLGLATTRKFRDRDGNAKEDTTFVDIDAFGKQAEALAKYLRKGSPLMVEGRLKLDQWEDPNSPPGHSIKRSKLSVVLESFQFIPDGKQDRSDGADRSDQTQPPADGALDEEPPF